MSSKGYTAVTDDIPDHLKFGYDAMIEKAEIRRELEAKGMYGWALFYAVQDEYMERHKDDPTYAETSKAFALKARENPIPAIALSFSEEERLYLRDVFKDANHPVARQIYERLK